MSAHTPDELLAKATRLITAPPPRQRPLSEVQREEAENAKFVLGSGAAMERLGYLKGDTASKLWAKNLEVERSRRGR